MSGAPSVSSGRPPGWIGPDLRPRRSPTDCSGNTASACPKPSLASRWKPSPTSRGALAFPFAAKHPFTAFLTRAGPRLYRSLSERCDGYHRWRRARRCWTACYFRISRRARSSRRTGRHPATSSTAASSPVPNHRPRSWPTASATSYRGRICYRRCRVELPSTRHPMAAVRRSRERRFMATSRRSHVSLYRE